MLFVDGPAAGLRLPATLAQLKILNTCSTATHQRVNWSAHERETCLEVCVSHVLSIVWDKGRGKGDSALLFEHSPSDSNGTFCLSFHGQAASGVDFVRADTEEHDYTQLTAL